jgi:hypothetical protein
MSLDDVDRPLSGAVSATEVIHRRWVLSKGAEDGRPLLVREDRIVHPNGFATGARRSPAAEAAEAAEAASGTPALR